MASKVLISAQAVLLVVQIGVFAYGVRLGTRGEHGRSVAWCTASVAFMPVIILLGTISKALRD